MKNTNESGRSMVEMLGVLAIIGVLSIGGIAGYTMAMNKYKANEIVSAVVQAAVECRTRGDFANEPLVAVGATKTGTTYCYKPTGAVAFQVTSTDEISRLVCKALSPIKTLTNVNANPGNDAITCTSDDAKKNQTMVYRPTT